MRGIAAALRVAAAGAVLLAAATAPLADSTEALPQPLLIGLAAPLSGSYAADGQEMRRAAEAAVAATNQTGGVLGARLALEVVDDGCERARALAAAERLVALKPALVVGHSCASAAVAAARVYAQAGLLMISPGARHPDLTTRRAGSTIFRLAGREDVQGTAAAAHLRAQIKTGRIAIVHDRTAIARRLAESTLAALAQAGAPAALVLTIVAGEKDYGALATRLAQAGVEGILFAGFPIEAGLVLRRLRAARSSALFLAPDFAATPELAEVAGAAAEGARVLLPYEPRAVAGASSFTAGLLAAAPRAPSPGGLWLRTFAALEAWSEAARRAGSVSPQAVLAVLGNAALPTAIGTVSFDAHGDVRLPSYEAWVWKDGDWERAP